MYSKKAGSDGEALISAANNNQLNEAEALLQVHVAACVVLMIPRPCWSSLIDWMCWVGPLRCALFGI